MARTRVQTGLGPPLGTYARVIGGVPSGSGGNQVPISPWYTSSITDTTGRRFEHAMSLTRRDNTGFGALNGVRVVGDTSWTYNNYYTGFATQAESHAVDSLPSTGVIATAALARSNPSKPYVSMPNLAYEMKDLPGMIRDIGRIKLYRNRAQRERRYGAENKTMSLRDIANHSLAAQMGWVPLISDLRKLLDFQAQTDRKITDLENLFVKNQGLRRTVGKPTKDRKGGTRAPLWSFTETTESEVSLSAVLGALKSRKTKTTSTVKWASVRWTSTARPSLQYSDKQLARLARSLVLGTNVNPKAIWDAIPWTWLVGWFTNLDDYVSAHSNVIPVKASTPLVMTHSRTEVTYARTDSISEISGGTGSKIYETKLRLFGSGTASATFPFLGARQLSILGALAIQRSR
jgi:hypothetical protein